MVWHEAAADMSLELTALLLGFSVAVAVFCGWRGARPPDFKRGPRMIPWRWLMLLSAAAALTLLIHILAVLQGQ
jgi:hypothetical protein